MKISYIGIPCLIGGILLGAYALCMDTSVQVDYSAIGGNFFGLPERVSNLDLMNKRSNYLTICGILCIVGVILIVARMSMAKKSSTTEHEEHTVVSQSPSVADEVSKLAELKEKGILSDEEFYRQMAKLLA